MLSMGHPDYAYRPAPKKVREKMRESQLRRLGIPSGHRMIYGQIIKERLAAAWRPMIYDVARRHGRAAAKSALTSLLGMSETLALQKADSYWLDRGVRRPRAWDVDRIAQREAKLLRNRRHREMDAAARELQTDALKELFEKERG